MLLCELVEMNCVSPKRVANTLEESFFTFNDLVLPAKVPERFSQTFFDKFLVF